MELVTAAEMRELDRAAIETRNIPSLRLMENAGKAVVEEMERFFGPLRGKAVTIVAGKGQNGGGGPLAPPRPRHRGRPRRGGLCAPPPPLPRAAPPQPRNVPRRPRGPPPPGH